MTEIRAGTNAFTAAGCRTVTSPCKHSGTGRDSTLQVLCFEIAWLGKQARSSLFTAFLQQEEPNGTQDSRNVGVRSAPQCWEPIIRLRSEGLPTRGPFPLWPIPPSA